MGLDMYIIKTARTNSLPLSTDSDVAYWRKFNALHGWFVDNVQIGIDNCDAYELTHDHLDDLNAVLNEVIRTKNPSLLAPRSGFFFGSSEADEYYWEKVNETSQMIKDLIIQTDWNEYKLFYQSCW